MKCSILCFAVFLVGASSQLVSNDVLQDLSSIFYNGIVTLQPCSGTDLSLSDITYTLYTRNNNQSGMILNSANYNEVDRHKRVVFIIHGWFQKGTVKWVTQMKDSYLNREPANVIVVDWSKYANALYGSAFCAVPQVGIFTGDLIYNLNTTIGVDLTNTQINGFSLGAHIGGYAGQQVQNRTGGLKIGKILSMDGAGPAYLNLPLNERLDAGDALFVQAIHTNAYFLGYGPGYATVDFYLNYGLIGCGVQQPGCPLYDGIPSGNDLSNLLPYFFCSHLRAAAYVIESIMSDNFIGVQCDNCTLFGSHKCDSQPTTIMGENCPTTASGTYYLNTNWNSPFAKGTAGIS